MTPISLPDEATLSVRWRSLGAAARAWIAAAWRRASGRQAAPGPAGVSLLENGGQRRPPRPRALADFNKKPSGLFVAAAPAPRHQRRSAAVRTSSRISRAQASAQRIVASSS
jgi:hypothetical protein